MNVEVTSNDGQWSLVKLRQGAVKGWVPTELIAKSGSIETEEFYAGNLNRKDVENQLTNGIENGSYGNFLLRKNRKRGFYCISVINGDSFCHYKINETPGEFGYGKTYNLFKNPTFQSVMALVEYYQRNRLTCGVHLELGMSCKIEQTIRPRDIWEVKINDLKNEVVIGQGNFGQVKRAVWKDQLTVAVKDRTYNL